MALEKLISFLAALIGTGTVHILEPSIMKLLTENTK